MKKSDVVIIIMVLIIILSYLFIKIFTNRINQPLLDYSDKKITNITSSLINKSISETLLNDEYEELINIEKNSDSEITNLNFDNLKINKILSTFTTNILNNIKNIEGDENLIFNIPVGLIHSSALLTNIGPKIPIKIKILSNILTDTKINIEDYGINNSLVEISLDLDMQVQVIFPFNSKIVNINKKILLDNKVIQGNIPTYYGGLNYLLK